MSVFVAKQIDSYVNQYGDQNPMWIANLSNGETVFQDDGRPDVFPTSAWERLKIYCESNDYHIVEIKFKNRSHLELVASGHEGDFFCKGVGALLYGSETQHSFIIGTLDNNKLTARKWNLPELIPDPPEQRDLERYKEILIRGE